MVNTPIVVTLLLCIISYVHAHDWMISPVPRGGVPDAQQVSPCEALTPTSAVTNLARGSPISVTWGNGHKTGTHTISFATYKQDTTVADFTVLEQVPASQTDQPQTFVVPADKLADYTIGNYTLRWSWTSYDNCATIRITGVAPSNALAAQPGVSINPVTNTPTVAGDYLLSDGSTYVGVYNAYTDTTTCKSGYTVSNDECVAVKKSGGGSGMSAGGKAALAIFLIALVGFIAYAGFAYHKNGNVFGVTPAHVKGLFSKKNNQDATRGSGAYTAYSEETA